MEKREASNLSTVLVVEDTHLSLEFILGMLKNHNYNLVTASSGKQALDLVEQIHPDLILLDVIMPDMSGWEVCKILKDNPANKEIPVIFLTSLTETDKITQGFKLGAVDYVVKPCKTAELLARINTHLALKHSREQLKETNSYKDKLFSIIAHDLRNPFTTLIGNTNLLYQSFSKFTDEEKLARIFDIKNACKQAHQLLENLLEWSQTQLQGIKYQPELFLLAELVHANYQTIGDMANAKQIRLSADIPPELSVYADKNTFQTVLRNLCTNALKFTPRGGQIKISANKHKTGVQVTVADTGIGMPESIKSNLFRISENVSRRGTEAEKGTGLGLILCKEFIERNGGTLQVESEEGRGTNIIVTVPSEKPDTDR